MFAWISAQDGLLEYLSRCSNHHVKITHRCRLTPFPTKKKAAQGNHLGLGVDDANFANLPVRHLNIESNYEIIRFPS
jgi:hypothetical protein